MYGKRKPIAVRKPLFPVVSKAQHTNNKQSPVRIASQEDLSHESSTPAITEGETASDTESDTETDMTPTPRMLPRSGLDGSIVRGVKNRLSKKSASHSGMSQHDLYHKYFRRDVVILHNIDLLRYGLLFLSLRIVYLNYSLVDLPMLCLSSCSFTSVSHAAFPSCLIA